MLMTNKEFIETFVLQYPNFYLRLVSFHLPFTETNLIRYGFMLNWDSLGLTGNSNVVWTPTLISKFARQLQKFPLKLSNISEISPSVRNENKKTPRVFLSEFSVSGGRASNCCKISDLTIEIIRANEFEPSDWKTISLLFPFTSYDLIIEFEDKIDFSLLRSNDSIDWSDIRIYSFFADDYRVISNKAIWCNFLKNYVTNKSLSSHIDAFHSLDRFIKITWKSEERINGSIIKYILAVYVKSPNGKRMITTGYYYSEKDLLVGSTLNVDFKTKYPIVDDYAFI